MQQFIVRDSEGEEITRVSAVLSCSLSEKLSGENTLKFTTLMKDGLETLSEGRQYSIEFEQERYDVVSFKKTVNGSLSMIEFDCEHVSYRLNNYKLDDFAATGTPHDIVVALLKGTGFIVGPEMAAGNVTYSSQESATIRKILMDFAFQIGQEVVFTNFAVNFVPHRGATEDAKILDGNVQEISKSVNVLTEEISYTLKLKPKIPVNVGDEVHLLFARLGIDDKVRVLGKTRTPFSSDLVTLEVGAYSPTLESESVRVLTDMVNKSSTYYGARISADNGLEVKRGDNKAHVVLNSDKMAFYQGNDEVLYFDPVARIWKLAASCEVHVRDADGNDTTMTALADGLTTRIQDADNHYIEIKETIEGLTVTSASGETLIDGGMIVTDNLRLHRLIAKDSPNSFIEMMTNGLNFVLGNANTIGIGYASAAIPLPYMIFGEGASPKSDQSGMIKFYSGGLWLGDSADRHSTSIQSGTGLFIDVPNDKVYVYINGEGTEVADMANLSALVEAKLEEYKPVAVFG